MTVNCCALFSFQHSLSRACVLLSWVHRMAFWVDYMKVACIRGWFHCMVSWWMRSPTFRLVFALGLNKSGWGSQFLSLTAILCPFPILHIESSLIKSLATSKLRQTNDGLWPNSASMKEHLGKYLALYTR